MSRALSTAVIVAGVLLATPLSADEEVLVTYKSLTPAVALEIARAAQASCRENGYQVTVAIVDRMGVTQVLLRDRFAGAHTVQSAQGKAGTAVSFRTSTLELAESTGPHSPQSGARFIDGVLMLGGGIPIMASGSIVAGIGVAGAPSGETDHGCAQAGIDAVTEKLELAD